MDFHQLRIFSSVFRHRSFTRASAELNISQPTISEHIKNLEEELSCRLFDRLGRSIKPTAEGEMLFPRAQQLLDSLDGLREDLAASTDNISGNIIFGASTIPATYIVPAMAVAFARHYPDVTFEVISDDTASIIHRIIDHELFMGIVGARISSDKLAFTPLVRDELLIVGNPKLVGSGRLTRNSICELPFLMREKGSGTRSCMEEHFRKEGIDPARLNTVATLGSTAAVREAALQGLGITVLSRMAVSNELKGGALKSYPLKGFEMGRDFYLVQHRRRTLPAHYQAFCQHLLEHFGAS